VPGEVPPFEELIAGTRRSAVHLEMRDAYVPGDPSFIAWQGGPPYDRTQREADWHALAGGALARGAVHPVRVRRDGLDEHRGRGAGALAAPAARV
jgi:hypothetical protein